ncbi:MAG: hypothetical protein IH884_01200 [Myxococcales bacterium]|nr:hypothetical protein [Myxococcales bacterium]
MARAAHPQAMQPKKPGTTRTAPPKMPDGFPGKGRYRTYVAFETTGLIYLLMGFIILRAIWQLGAGEAGWNGVMDAYQNPIMIGFHLLALVGVIFVGVRFFWLFPKAQPPRIGPVRPPPAAILKGMLYSVWIGTTLVMTWVLAGGAF